MKAYTIDGSELSFTASTFATAISSISINFLKDDLTGPEDLAAKFPKYCKARISGVSCRHEPSYRTVVFPVSLATNKATGDVNETAVKRRAKTLEILDQLGLSV